MLTYLNSRLARVVLATVIIVALVGVGAQRTLYETSIEAVVNAPRVDIEAPTEGLVDAIAAEPGREITTGAMLVTLRRHAWSRTPTGELGQRAQLLRAQVTAYEAKLATLERLRDSLGGRVRYHRGALVDELTASLAAARARAEERTLNERRVAVLKEQQGFTEADHDRARAEVAVARSDVALLEVRLEAARRGTITAQGAMDVPYSQQRVDEIAMQLATLRTDLAAARAELAAITAGDADHLDSTEAGTIPVRATVNGVVWSTRHSRGAHVEKGAVLATLIDCSRLYLDATISPRYQDRVVPGAPVLLRFAGSSEELPGQIAYVRGGGMREDEVSAAKLTLLDRDNNSHAIIRVDPSSIGAEPGNFCQVGRSAKVIFDGPGLEAFGRRPRAASAPATLRPAAPAPRPAPRTVALGRE